MEQRHQRLFALKGETITKLDKTAKKLRKRKYEVVEQAINDIAEKEQVE